MLVRVPWHESCDKVVAKFLKSLMIIKKKKKMSIMN